MNQDQTFEESSENLEEEITFAMIERLNRLSKTIWENLRVSCILESMAVSDVTTRISNNIGSLLSEFFMIKNLWIIEYKHSSRKIQGHYFDLRNGGDSGALLLQITIH